MKVMAAIANYKGWLAEDCSKSLEALFLYQPKEGEPQIEWMRTVSKGCAVLPRVRNHLVSVALQEGCHGILFIDDDIGFDAKDVYRMIGRGYGLIGAVPQKRNHRWNDPPSLAVAPSGMKFFSNDTGYDVGIPPEPKLPMALTFIASPVFREIEEAGLAPRYIYTPASGQKSVVSQFFGYELVPAPEWCLEYKVGKELGLETPMCEDGEDHFFCRRAAQVGYESLIDLTVELRHWEGQVLHDYSFKKYLAEHKDTLQAISEVRTKVDPYTPANEAAA